MKPLFQFLDCILVVSLVTASEVYWTEMETPSETAALKCSGVNNVTVAEFGVTWNVRWNISEVYRPSGVLLFPTVAATHTYRTTVCGALKNATCASKPWNLERVNRSKTEECLKGITEWKDQTVNDNEVWRVRYFLKSQRESTEDEPMPVGVTVEVLDEVDDASCTFGMAKGFFDVICSTDATEYRSIEEDLDNCIWNVSIHSANGCVDYTTLWQSTSAPTTTESQHSGGGNDDDDELGWGYIFIIVLLSFAVLYCIGGTVYNYRVNEMRGKYAIPQFKYWRLFWLYVGAGFVVSYKYLRGLCSRDDDNSYKLTEW